MTISVKKASISSKLTTVYLSCPPLCGLFSIQQNAKGGLSYKVKNGCRYRHPSMLTPHLLFYYPFLHLHLHWFHRQNCCVSRVEIQRHNHTNSVHKHFFFMIFAHSMKSKKTPKVSKFKDFYIFFLCSAITVSTVLSLSQQNSCVSLSPKYTGKRNFMCFRNLPSGCSYS